MKDNQKPNVLFIAVDDLRPFLGCYGDVNARTPHIDSLAQRGVTFTNAMCTAPSCGPSRAALLTGQFPTRTGLYGFQDWAGRTDFESIITLPEHFRKNGYKTFSSGKIHHDSVRTHSYTKQAVETNRASEDPDPAVMVPRADREWSVNNVVAVRNANYSHAPCMADCINWSGGSGEGPPASVKLVSGPSDDPVMDCMDGITAQFGMDVLKQKHEKPFFLATGFVRPHLPFIAPRKYFDQYPLDSLQLHPVKEDDLADSPWVARRNARVQDDINIRKADPRGRARVIQAYYACASFVDDMIGMVLSELARSPYADNTVVVFWSDHGWHLGEKRSWRKFSLWEESARTPMIIADPRKTTSAGRICERPVGLIDIYPTLIDLCGIPQSPGVLDGASLRPLLEDPSMNTPQVRTPELTVQGRGNYSLRDEEWRYTVYFDGGEELYNHKNDPYEWENLAESPSHAQEKARLASFLPVNAVPTVEPTGFRCWADADKEDMEQFRSAVWPRWLQEADPPLE